MEIRFFFLIFLLFGLGCSREPVLDVRPDDMIGKWVYEAGSSFLQYTISIDGHSNEVGIASGSDEGFKMQSLSWELSDHKFKILDLYGNVHSEYHFLEINKKKMILNRSDGKIMEFEKI